jgi:uncharacterized protein
MTIQTKINNRIEIIDVLRGFTLLGIALIHFAEQYYAGVHPKEFENFNILFLGDEITMGFIGILISGKFFLIFSFLFGLSFFLQKNKAEASGHFIIRFFWRLVILFAIGMLHHVHYRGDILTIYAVLGVVLLLFNRLHDKLLLVIAICLAINLPSVIVRGITAWRDASQNLFSFDDVANKKYYLTIKSGSYAEIISANYHEHAGKFRIQVLLGRIYITLGLFLLGLYAGRKKLFERVDEQLPFFKVLLKRSAWLILGVVLFAAAFFGGAQLVQLSLPEIVRWTVGGFLFDVFNLGLASIYVAAIVLLFQKKKWKSRLMHFYEPGRMGLTTYLMQTFFGTLLFFGFGFGMLGEIGALMSIGIAILIFIFQIYFSKWWLARFQYGFFEWLWRCGTYLKWQSLKKS